MRRLLWIVIPAVLLVAAMFLARATATLHYVLSGESGAVVYAATFDDFLDEWILEDDGQLSAAVVDARLKLTVGDTNRYFYALTRPYFAALDLRVRATVVDGPLNNGYGVVFGFEAQDERSASHTWGGLLQSRVENLLLGAPRQRSLYMFLLSSDGYYQVRHESAGRNRVISDWIQSDAVVQGIGASNDLRVMLQDGAMAFEINGVRVPLCIPDDPTAISTIHPLDGSCIEGQMLDVYTDPNAVGRVGRVGVVAQTLDMSGVVVEFDDLLVMMPDVEEFDAR